MDAAHSRTPIEGDSVKHFFQTIHLARVRGATLDCEGYEICAPLLREYLVGARELSDELQKWSGHLQYSLPIRLSGLWIEGDLDLRGCLDVPAFSLECCIINGSLRLEAAKLKSVWLDGSIVHAVRGTRCDVDGTLYFRGVVRDVGSRIVRDLQERKDDEGPFTALNGIDLSGAWIRGSVSLRGAILHDGSAASWSTSPKTEELLQKYQTLKSANKIGPSALRLVETEIKGRLIMSGGNEHRRGTVDERPRELRLLYKEVSSTAAIAAPEERTAPYKEHPSMFLPSTKPAELIGSVELRAMQTTELLDVPTNYLHITKQSSSWHLSLESMVYSRLAPESLADIEFRFNHWLPKPDLKLPPFCGGKSKDVPSPRTKPFSPQPYAQLARVLREQGFEAEARRVQVLRGKYEHRTRITRRNLAVSAKTNLRGMRGSPRRERIRFLRATFVRYYIWWHNALSKTRQQLIAVQRGMSAILLQVTRHFGHGSSDQVNGDTPNHSIQGDGTSPKNETRNTVRRNACLLFQQVLDSCVGELMVDTPASIGSFLYAIEVRILLVIDSVLRGLTGYGYNTRHLHMIAAILIVGGVIGSKALFVVGSMTPAHDGATATTGWKDCAARHIPGDPVAFRSILSVKPTALEKCLAIGDGSSEFPSFYAIPWALDAFLPVIDLQQTEYWIPAENRKFGKLGGLMLVVYRIAGWIYASLALGAIAARFAKRSEE
ncbi:MAG: hypothetical protein IBJ03_01255 [Gemmatimonadaceae bacterium]|nr:hypothetical protein [Gemmatimonadaceae bacterium]